MRKLMGLVVSVLLFAAILTGCAGTADGNDSSDIAASTQDTGLAGDTSLENTSTESDLNSTENTEEAVAWPRTYVDSLGHEVTLEEEPERIVSVFHAMYPDYLYALGAYPVGVASADTLLNQWAAYKDFTSVHTVEDIGGPTDPNLEKILELKPDLILASSFNEDIYDELSQIAPTVILDYTKINSDREYGLTEFAKLLGKEEQVDTVLNEVEDSIKEGAKELEDFQTRNESVIFISITEKDIWPYTVSQLQVIYNEETGLGLKAPDGYSDITDSSQAISLEALAQYNPDHIFIMTDYGDDTAKQWLEELTDNSVWASITAVKEGNIYFTDRSVFAFNSPIATEYGVGLVVDSLTN